MPSIEFPASSGKLPLVVIVGPTAVGKTEISLQLAQRLAGEIVSADSRLFYTGMDIGTAKPSAEERSRVPHHLVDVSLPDQAWSLAIFQQEARRAIESIHSLGKLPFLVGGTGQYIRAVIEGWDIPKVEPHPILRRALEDWGRQIGSQGLHDRLRVLDGEAAEKIDPTNVRRTVRALEVILSTGKAFSLQRQRSKSPYRSLLLGIQRPRAELYGRIDLRIEQMIARGLVEEVRRLLEQGYAPDLPTLSAIGYREIIAYLQGKTTLEEAVVLMKRQTRVFVRRQANWFKESDAAIRWFSAGEGIVDDMEAAIKLWLGTLTGTS